MKITLTVVTPQNVNKLAESKETICTILSDAIEQFRQLNDVVLQSQGNRAPARVNYATPVGENVVIKVAR